MYKSNKNYILQKIQDKYALVGLADMAAQMHDMMLLNESAAFMVRMFDDGEPHSTDDVEMRLCEEFNIPEGTDLLADFRTVASKMLENGYWVEL